MVTGADAVAVAVAVAVDAVIGAWLGRPPHVRPPHPSPTHPSPTHPSPTHPSPTATPRCWSRSRWTPETVRGATDAEGNQIHLLAAATHAQSLVLGQVEVGAKTGEIPMFARLLDTLADAGVDLSQTVITADALHTQRAHAEY